MRLDVVTIFPDYFAPLQLSLVGKAIASGIVDADIHDLRTWTHDRHHTVDDTPYGGGAGMVMKPEPWGEALDALEQASPQPMTVIVTTPAGQPFTQDLAYELADKQRLVFACGRYEGIDQRVIDHCAEKYELIEISLGDYVLNGGEVAALAIIEAIVRLLPGVVGNPDSLVEESHAPQHRLLEYPNYTKPPAWRGREVPEILFSGHHAKIAEWRLAQARKRTSERRPDLLAENPPTAE